MTLEELAESIADLPKEKIDALFTTDFAKMSDIENVLRKEDVEGKYIESEKLPDFATKDYVGKKITENNIESGNAQTPDNYVDVKDLEF